VTPFGAVRSQAFAILPREALLTAGKRLCEKPISQLEFRWQAIDRAAARFKQNLRPLATTLEFSAQPATSPWHAALCFASRQWQSSGTATPASRHSTSTSENNRAPQPAVSARPPAPQCQIGRPPDIRRRHSLRTHGCTIDC
jgi:hypothetical protein